MYFLLARKGNAVTEKCNDKTVNVRIWAIATETQAARAQQQHTVYTRRCIQAEWTIFKSGVYGHDFHETVKRAVTSRKGHCRYGPSWLYLLWLCRGRLYQNFGSFSFTVRTPSFDLLVGEETHRCPRSEYYRWWSNKPGSRRRRRRWILHPSSVWSGEVL